MAWFRPEDERDNAAVAPKSVVIGRSRFNWAKDCRPEIPWGKTVIYEAHVKGFTKQFPDLKYAGTYKALSDKRVLAYLQELGVTTVELLPIHYHLDEYHLQQMGLSNYWGYNTYSHFAVEPSYADNPERAAAEFKQAVKALHQAGFGSDFGCRVQPHGRTGRQRPDAVSARYRQHFMVLAHLLRQHENWSGCGNTLNIVRRDVTRWAADSLRYWAEEFHVDGFRFDLGTVLGREPDFQSYGRFFQVLYQDPVLAGLKLIVEAWDIGEGGYHLGNFPQPLPNGTAVSAMICARFGHGKAVIWVHLPNAWPGRPIFSTTAAADRLPASTSLPHTTASLCAIWSATTKNTTTPTAKTTAMGIMKTSVTTTA